MKINTGNFGNNGLQLGMVHTENPEALAGVNAEKQAAQSTMQAQDTIQAGLRAESQAAQNRGQAWGAVGQTVANIGTAMVEHAQALARQKAELQLQDYGSFKDGVLQDIEQQVSDGRLGSTNIKDYYTKKMGEWKREEIPDITGSAQQALTRGMQVTDRQADRTVGNIYEKAVRVERVNAADQLVAGINQSVLQPGADVNTLKGRLDEFFNREDTRGLYGASWTTKYNGAVKSLQTNFFQAQIEQNRSDNGALDGLRSQVMQIEDPATRTSLLNSIDTKQNSNTAKAIAAQNHADAVATRRELAATHLDSVMQQRIANGEHPSDEDFQKYDETVAGTSVTTTSADLSKTYVATQAVLARTPAEGQQWVDTEKQKLQINGGSKTDYQVVDAVQRGIDTRNRELKENPQRVGMNDAGTTLAPVRIQDGIDQPGQLGAALVDRKVNSDFVGRKYGATAGKNLLTPDEKKNWSDAYTKMSTDQKTQFWRNIQASAGPEIQRQLATEMGDGAPTVAAVAGLATTPNGYKAAMAVVKGDQLLNPVDGAAKVKTPPEADFADAIRERYPNLTPAQVAQAVPVAMAQHAGLGRTADEGVNDDDLDAVVAQPVKVYGQTIYAPPGSNVDAYAQSIKDSVQRLPGDAAGNVRNHLNDGSYTLVPDIKGDLRLINVNTQRAVTINGVPYVVTMP